VGLSAANSLAVPCDIVREVQTFEFRDHKVTVDFLRPNKASHYPIVLMLPGVAGVYTDSEKDNFGEHQLACAGKLAVIVHFLDVSDVRFASQPIIARDAMLWIEEVKVALNFIDKSPFAKKGAISVLGESLGGFLAIAVGLEDPRIKLIVTMSAGFAEQFSSQIKNDPNVLMYHSMSDTVIPFRSAVEACAKLVRAGVKCALRAVDHSDHVLSKSVVQSIVRDLIAMTQD